MELKLLRRRCGVVGASAQKEVGVDAVELLDLRWVSLGTLTFIPPSTRPRFNTGHTQHGK
jgi:hypothetical protein